MSAPKAKNGKEREQFVEYNYRMRRSQAFVALTEKMLGLTREFSQVHQLSSLSCANLSFDKRRRVIRLIVQNSQTDASFHIDVIRQNEGSGYRRINMVGFYKYFGIDPRLYKGRYEPKLVEQSPHRKVFDIRLKKNE